MLLLESQLNPPSFPDQFFLSAARDNPARASLRNEGEKQILVPSLHFTFHFHSPTLAPFNESPAFPPTPVGFPRELLRGKYSHFSEPDLPERQSTLDRDGKILAIGRGEAWGGVTTARAQHQLTSTDYGATWKRAQTNIGEVMGSTPSLILDAKTGLVSNYYYQRGRGGILRRRVVDPALIFENPLKWPASEAIATGSEDPLEAGNVNATSIKDTHFLAFYSGHAPNTSVLVTETPAPGVFK